MSELDLPSVAATPMVAPNMAPDTPVAASPMSVAVTARKGAPAAPSASKRQRPPRRHQAPMDPLTAAPS